MRDFAILPLHIRCNSHRPGTRPGAVANRSAARRVAFTLIEVLVCLAIIVALISLLLPAVQAAREAARRYSCANNLSQLMLAIENYESSHAALPPGTIDAKRPLESRPVGYHMSWIAQILPFIEQSPLYRNLDFSVSAYDRKNAGVRRYSLALLICPSDFTSGIGGSHYAGCHHDLEAPIDEDNHGVLFLNSNIRYRDIRDGRGQTIALGEILLTSGAELGWLSGSRSTLRNTGTPINNTTSAGGLLAAMVVTGEVREGLVVPLEEFSPQSPLPGNTVKPPWFSTDEYRVDEALEYQPSGSLSAKPSLVVGGFESRHGEGAQFAFADGSVRFLAETVDSSVYRHLGHRADGQLLDDR